MILYLKNLLKRRSLIIILLVITISLAFVTNFFLRNLEKKGNLLSVANVISVNTVKTINQTENLLPVADAVSVITANPINQKANLLISSLPILIKIPSIKVNATIEQVGLTQTGAMDSPVGPKEAGWFSLGVKPGEVGSSVIDGHSGWKNNIQAIFDNLYKIKIGDKIYVTDDKGITKTFIVKVIKKLDPVADANSVFTSNDGKAHLNLITCTGLWDAILKSHSQRLVVFTDLETK